MTDQYPSDPSTGVPNGNTNTRPKQKVLNYGSTGSILQQSAIRARIEGMTSHQEDLTSPPVDEEIQPLLAKEPQPWSAVEEGWQGYSVCVGAWFALLPSSGLLNTIGTLQAYLGSNQLEGLSQQEISWIFSVYAYLFMFGGVQVGPLFDAYGLRPLFIPGCIGSIISIMGFSFCNEFYQFMLVYGILGGISGSLLWTTSVTTVGHWFYYRRGIATGFVLTSGPIGGVIFPLVFDSLVTRIGFPWTVRVLGFISIASFVVAIALVKARLPPTHRLKWESNFLHFTDLRFILTILGMFTIELAVLIPPAYLTVYALAKGLETRLSYQLLAILNTAQIPGRVLPGFVADRCGRFNTMIFTSLPCSIVIQTLWLKASSVAAIVAFTALFALLSGTAHSLTAVCISQLCTTEEYGGVYGTAYYVVSLSYLVGIPIAGMMLDGSGRDFQPLILYCGSMYMASTGFFIMARVAGTGFRLTAIY